MMIFTLKPLPVDFDLKTRAVLRKTASAHRYLAELKGMVATTPNESILISTLTLQEAKDSSEIENIITTHDDLYKSALFSDFIKSPAAKEVGNYAGVVQKGFAQVRQSHLLTINHILKIHRELEHNDAGAQAPDSLEIAEDLQVSITTATKYLAQLTGRGFLTNAKIGRYNHYINEPLVKLFMNFPDK